MTEFGEMIKEALLGEEPLETLKGVPLDHRLLSKSFYSRPG